MPAVGLWCQTRGGETEKLNRLASTSPCELKASLFYTVFPLREFSVSNSKTEDVKDDPDSLHAGRRLAKVREEEMPASCTYTGTVHLSHFKIIKIYNQYEITIKHVHGFMAAECSCQILNMGKFQSNRDILELVFLVHSLADCPPVVSP